MKKELCNKLSLLEDPKRARGGEGSKKSAIINAQIVLKIALLFNYHFAHSFKSEHLEKESRDGKKQLKMVLSIVPH